MLARLEIDPTELISVLKLIYGDFPSGDVRQILDSFKITDDQISESTLRDFMHLRLTASNQSETEMHRKDRITKLMKNSELVSKMSLN